MESPFKHLTEYLLIFVHFTIALPQEEESLCREEIEILFKQSTMSFRDIYPIESVKTLEIMFFEKTLEERIAEREKGMEERVTKKVTQEVTKKVTREMANKVVLNLHSMGLQPEEIAPAVDLDKDAALAIIKKKGRGFSQK